MMKRMIKMSLLLWTIMASALCHSNCYGQIQSNDASNQPIELHLTNATLIYALSTLAVDYRIPVGLEVSDADHNEARINITLKNAKLRDVLDSIVKQDKNYRWEIRDGVVNFIPVRSRNEVLKSLLDTRIAHFAPKNGFTPFEIRSSITELPEVKSVLLTNKVYAINIDNINGHSVYIDKTFNLDVSDMDIRGILNKIVRESAYKLWMVQRYGKNKDGLLISF
jgi:hypothetical protein